MKNEDLINKFNTMFPVGSKVRWRSVGKDGVPYEVLTVQDSATLLSGHSPVAWFKERIGCCSIEERFVDYTPVADEPTDRADLAEPFEQWLAESKLSKIVPTDGHARRAFEAGWLACGQQFNDRMDTVEVRIANAEDVLSAPLDIVLHCPNCKMQHIDRAEPDICECGCSKSAHEPITGSPVPDGLAATRSCEVCGNCDGFVVAWDNPPHTSHLCKPADGGCGHKFRPADVPTNGVEAAKTRGANDTWPVN